jgi:hypothetical protein
MSLEKSNAELRSDRRSTQSGLELLGKVGIVELLEQDERPTFIIDVANPANFTPGGPLQIVFANASLRAHEVSVSAALFLTLNGDHHANIIDSRYWRRSPVKQI